MTTSATFGKPFALQVAAFRLRLAELKATAKWDDLWQSEHDRAFMVAGALKADLLADLATAVDRSISQGGTLQDFRRDFRKIVEERGWHGWTGEGTKKGEAWRTRVIYRTNMATSYAAGRYGQLTEGNYAFWIYFHGNSLEPRVQHLAWDGLILPPNHPFWATHFPPNGWGCSCRVSGARSMASAVRRGGKADLKLPGDWAMINAKTGAPMGIGKGWAYAPGATAAADIAALAAKPLNWDFNLAIAYMHAVPAANRDLLSSAYRDLPSFQEGLKRYVEKVSSTPTSASSDIPELKTLGLVPDLQRQKIFDLVEREDGPSLYDFVVDQSAIRHVLSRHTNAKIEASRGQRIVEPDDFARLGILLNDPDRIDRGDPTLGHPAVIRIEKQFGAERMIAIFEVRPGRRRIALVSMWVEVNAGAPPTITP